MVYLQSEIERITGRFQYLPSMCFRNQSANVEKSELVAGRKKKEEETRNEVANGSGKGDQAEESYA